MLAMLLIWPVYLGVKTSFTHDVLSEFTTYGAGLENYKNLINQPNFWLSLRFTMIYAIIATILEVILGLLWPCYLIVCFLVSEFSSH